MAEREFQTRNWAGKLEFFSSLVDAVNAYKQDREIFKISFDDMRWRVKHKQQKLGCTAFENEKIEEHLCSLSPNYAGEQDADALYFVWQDAYDVEKVTELKRLRREKKITKAEFDVRICTVGLYRILSEREFLAEFG
jgi:hypothetical protein